MKFQNKIYIYMYMYIFKHRVFPSWKSPSVSEQLSPAAVALQRTVASPKHRIWNCHSQSTTSTTPNQPRNNLLAGKHHSQTEAVKGTGHEHLDSFHLFPPKFCVRGLLLSTPGWKSGGVRGRLCLQGRLQIRTWQLQSPRSSTAGSGSGTADLCNPAPTEEKTTGWRAARPGDSTKRLPKQPRSLQSASCCIPSHLHGSGAQPPEGHGAGGCWIRRIWGEFPALPWAQRIPGAAPPSPPRQQWEKPKTRAGIESASPIH